MKCKFCQNIINSTTFGADYEVKPCANGDLKVRAQYVDGGIVLFKDCHIASGYFDINYCPICGRQIKKGKGE